MFRILFSVAVAAAAFFGPWLAEPSSSAVSGTGEAVWMGQDYAGGTIRCLIGGQLSVTGDCAPERGLAGLLVASAVVLGVCSAMVNVVGLWPLVRRATSVVAIGAGAAAIAAFAAAMMGTASEPASVLADLRWGAFATGGFGLLCAVTGLEGISPGRADRQRR